MPHTNRKSNVPPPPFKAAEFVNVTLGDAERAAIKAVEYLTEAFDTSLSTLIGDGYKVSLRFDERNDSYACWLIAPDRSQNKGLILSGRGSTALKAIRQALYIHYTILSGVWTGHEVQQRDVIDD